MNSFVCPECKSVASTFSENKFGEICWYVGCPSGTCAMRYRVGPFPTDGAAITAWERLMEMALKRSTLYEKSTQKSTATKIRRVAQEAQAEVARLSRTLDLMESLWVRFGHLIPAVLMLHRERRTQHIDKIVKYLQEAVQKEYNIMAPTFSKGELAQLMVNQNERFNKVYRERRSRFLVRVPRTSD